MKQNCWEVKRCGREPGGRAVQELGVCPAATLETLHGAHGGKHAGRACWAVVGTLCQGEVQGSFAAKIDNCLECDFYHTVKREEGSAFMLTAVLLKRLAG